MVEPFHTPENRFITDSERQELRALYTEAQALADSDGETPTEERTTEIACKTPRSV